MRTKFIPNDHPRETLTAHDFVSIGIACNAFTLINRKGGEASQAAPFAPLLIIRLDPPLKRQDCDERPVQNFN